MYVHLHFPLQSWLYPHDLVEAALSQRTLHAPTFPSTRRSGCEAMRSHSIRKCDFRFQAPLFSATSALEYHRRSARHHYGRHGARGDGEGRRASRQTCRVCIHGDGRVAVQCGRRELRFARALSAPSIRTTDGGDDIGVSVPAAKSQIARG